MKIVSIASYATPTYDYFRREVARFIAQTKVKNLSEGNCVPLSMPPLRAGEPRNFRETGSSWPERRR